MRSVEDFESDLSNCGTWAQVFGVVADYIDPSHERDLKKRLAVHVLRTASPKCLEAVRKYNDLRSPSPSRSKRSGEGCAVTLLEEGAVTILEETPLDVVDAAQSFPIEAFEADLSTSKKHSFIKSEERRMREEFYHKYTAAKSRSGLHTQRQVAERTGLSRPTIIAIEKYRTLPRFATIERLAKAFGVEVVDLQPSRAASSR